MAMTAKNMPYKQGFGPFAGEVYRMPLAYPFRWPTGPENCGPEALAAVICKIDKEIGADQRRGDRHRADRRARAGSSCPAKASSPGSRTTPRPTGIVFVADEVQTGFARTGAMFACEHEGVVPDLIVTAKGIAGGLPLAAVTGRAELMDAPHVGGLGGTYGGNPVACAAALGAIATIEEQDLVGAAQHIGEIMLPFLRDLPVALSRSSVTSAAAARWSPSSSSGPGTLEPAPEVTSAVAAFCHAEGVLVLTAGTYGNVLRFLPPLVIDDAPAPRRARRPRQGLRGPRLTSPPPPRKAARSRCRP